MHLSIAIKYHYETWGVDPSFVVGKPGMGTIGFRLLCLPWLAVLWHRAATDSHLTVTWHAHHTLT